MTKTEEQITLTLTLDEHARVVMALRVATERLSLDDRLFDVFADYEDLEVLMRLRCRLGGAPATYTLVAEKDAGERPDDGPYPEHYPAGHRRTSGLSRADLVRVLATFRDVPYGYGEPKWRLGAFADGPIDGDPTTLLDDLQPEVEAETERLRAERKAHAVAEEERAHRAERARDLAEIERLQAKLARGRP